MGKLDFIFLLLGLFSYFSIMTNFSKRERRYEKAVELLKKKRIYVDHMVVKKKVHGA